MPEALTQVPSARDIILAHERIRELVHRTPILSSKAINEITGARILFKCENFQKVGAFKARGAANAVFSLGIEELKKGVCTHSSGNHAQALARAAALAGTVAYVVMPSNSNPVKVEAVKGYGGKITFCEPNLASREETLEQVMKTTGATEIHPYNDPRIIAGQATAAKEFIEDAGVPDILIAPVGGGGLLSGTSLSATYFGNGILVIGAEPEMANDAYLSFTRKTLVPSSNPQTIADGLRTSLGTLTFPIILKHVDRIITAREDTIVDAMRLIWERLKILIEPSSAVPLAALLENPGWAKDKSVGIILSGGNVDLDNLPWLNQ